MRLNASAVVFVVNLGLAAALVMLWSDAGRSRWKEPEPLPPALDELTAPGNPEPAEVSRYRETLERPLFAATRKIAPRRDPAGDDQQAADSLADVRLVGTYGAGGRGGVIVVRNGKVERIPVGDRIGRWKVAGEDGRGAALVRESGERRKLELELNSAAAPSPAAAGKAAAPEAPQAAAAEATGSDAAKPAVPSPRAAGTVRAAPSGARSEEARQKQIERINARRAQRGLPPLTN